MLLHRLLSVAMWLVALAQARPQANPADSQYYQQDSRGEYGYRYTTRGQRSEADPDNQVRRHYTFTDPAGQTHGVEYTAGVNGFVPRILVEDNAAREPAVPQPNTDRTNHYTTDTENFNPRETGYHESNIRRDYYKDGRAFYTTRTRGEKALNRPVEYITNPVVGRHQNDQNDDVSHIEKSILSSSVESQNEPVFAEEGTEETGPDGNVRGRYTYKEHDGAPATIEYEAGPEIGFVVKSLIRRHQPQLAKTGHAQISSGSEDDFSSFSSKTQDSLRPVLPNDPKPDEIITDTLHLGPGVDPSMYVRRDYYKDGGVFYTTYNRGEKKLNRPVEYIANPVVGRHQNDQNDEVSHIEKSILSYSVESQNGPVFAEEGAEETGSDGNVRGRYTYKEHDGVPATIEYEAGPEIGFVVKSLIRHQPQLAKTWQAQISSRSQDDSSSFPINKTQDSLTPAMPNYPKPDEITDTLPLGLVVDPPRYEHAMVLAKYEPKSKTIQNTIQDDQRVQPSVTLKSPPPPNPKPCDHETNTPELPPPEEAAKELDEISSIPKIEEEVTPPFDASYKFGFSADGQTRNEEADAKGNIHGSYSYTGSDGVLTKVEYEAGAGQGFVVKRFTYEQTNPTETLPQSEDTTSQSHSSVQQDKSSETSLQSEDINNQNYHPEQIENGSEDLTVNQNSEQPKATNGEILETGVDLKENIDAKNDGVDSSYSSSYETPNQSREESANTGYNISGKISPVAKDDGSRSKVNYEASAGQGLDAKGYLPHESTQAVPSLAVEGIPNINSDGSYETPHQSRNESADAEGHYSFVAKDDEVRSNVSYEAGAEKGYSAEGSHIQPTQDQTPGTPEIKHDGSYSYSYETSEQSKKETADNTGNVQGEFSYTPPDGVRRTVSYKENPEMGFVAKGSHLLTAETTAIKKEIKPEETLLVASPTLEESSGKTVSNGGQESIKTDVVNDQETPKSDGIFSYIVADDSKVEPGNGNRNNQKISPQTSIIDDNEKVEPSSTVSATRYTDNSSTPSSQVILDLSTIRRAVAVGDKDDQTISQTHRKVTPKQPANTLLQQNFTGILPDGSYNFSYETNDQSREESVDAEGNVRSSYKFKTKGDDQTVEVLITRTVKEHAKNPSTEDTSNEKESDKITENKGITIENPTKGRSLSTQSRTQSYNQRRHIQETPGFVPKRSGVRKVVRKIVHKTDPLISRSLQRLPPTPVLLYQSSNATSKVSFVHPIETNSFEDKETQNNEEENIKSESTLPSEASEPLLTKPFRGNVKYKIHTGTYGSQR